MKTKMVAVFLLAALLAAAPALKTERSDSLAAVQDTALFAAAAEDESGPKEKAKEQAKEKPPKQDKKYDDFRDKNGNGIDDRYEKKEPPKKKKKDDPGEIQGLGIGD